jgi:peptidylprolyl isomerase
VSHRRILALVASLSLLPAALAAPVVAQDDAPAPPEATPNPSPAVKPAGDGTGIRITTDLGDIVIGLFNESAPVAAENFQNLVESGYYDGTGFHRVVRDFVIQGGDPEGTGQGGPGYTIADEEVVGTYERGIVAMARTQAPNSQGSQFFVVLDDDAEAPLESARTYVIFGRVLEGMDVVDAIAAQGPAADFIEDPVRILSTAIEPVELPEEADPPPPSAADAAAAALLSAVPSTILGLDIESSTFNVDQIIAAGTEGDPAPVALAAAAEANGASLDELSIISANAQDAATSVAMVVASIPGVPAAEIDEALIELILGGIGPDAVVTDEVISDVAVTRVKAAEDAPWEDIIHIVEDADRTWFIVTDLDSIVDVVTELPIQQ